MAGEVLPPQTRRMIAFSAAGGGFGGALLAILVAKILAGSCCCAAPGNAAAAQATGADSPVQVAALTRALYERIHLQSHGSTAIAYDGQVARTHTTQIDGKSDRSLVAFHGHLHRTPLIHIEEQRYHGIVRKIDISNGIARREENVICTQCDLLEARPQASILEPW